MKLISRIRALFTLKGKQQAMELASAEVRQNGVYFRPAENPDHKYFVKADEVDLIIKPGAEITEEDIRILPGVENEEPTPPQDPVTETTVAEVLTNVPENPSEEPGSDEEPSEKDPPEGNAPSHRKTFNPPENEYVVGPGWSKPKKKSFTVMLYPDEHEKLMRLIKDNGYKKVEYILACVDSAKKTSMEANYKRYAEEREHRRKEEALEAKRAKEEAQKAKQEGVKE